MLNISKDDRDWMIISYFGVLETDYQEMRKREWDYDEVEVDIYNLDKQKVSTGIVFISKKQVLFQGEEVSLIRDDIEPEQRYLDICIDAIKTTPYLDQFLDSTYMGCGDRKLEI